MSLRRSKRGQPILVSSFAPQTSTGDTDSWATPPIYTRSSTRSDMLDDEEPLESSATLLYESFTREISNKKPLRTYGSKSRSTGGSNETFSVGDTVFVRTSAPKPSIGVITSLWEVKRGEEEEEEEEDEDEGEEETLPAKMRVNVHWFIRPGELASVRAHREHRQNEIYYSLNTHATFPTSEILGHCTVTSQIPSESSNKSRSVAVSTSKRRKVATEVDDDGREQFYCGSAIDSRRGLYYEFSWKQQREYALDSRKNDVPDDPDEDEDPWNVDVDEEVPKTPKSSPRKKKVAKDIEDLVEMDQDAAPFTPSKRGRPKKKIVEEEPEEEIQTPSRTRVRKIKKDNDEEEDELPTLPIPKGKGKGRAIVADEDEFPQTPSRKGRKTKKILPEDEVEDAPQTPSRPRRSTKKTSKVGEEDEDEEPQAKSLRRRQAKTIEDDEDYEAPQEEPDSDFDAGATTEPSSEAGHEDSRLPTPPPQASPSRKRKRSPSSHTPLKPKARTRKSLALPTPHSKAALRARRRKSSALVASEFANKHLNLDGLEKVGRDPWLRAMHVLHVAARPEALPCREEEFGRVLRVVEGLVEEGSGGCVYISGVPGTGKTATVHAVIRELKRMAQNSETNPFTYVEINGLKIPEPSAAYTLLWEAVSGHDVGAEGHLKMSANQALKQLSKHFSGSGSGRAGPGGHACVVLMDELDQLVTTKQDVVYNFFNWPTLVGSKLVVIAVANTMDLPERVMSGRVRSRLGMIRINFQPYTTPQLEKIVHSRLASAKEGLEGKIPDVILPDGVKFAAMKVSSISGDARRVLDICRRTAELVQPYKRTAKTDDVKSVIKVMQNSPTAAYVRECSFHERLMLASLLKCVKNGGVEEVRWGDVQHQHLIYILLLSGDSDPTRRPTSGELTMVLDSLLASRALIMEESWGGRKEEGERRVMMNLEQGEVERVLGEVGGMRWKNVLGG